MCYAALNHDTDRNGSLRRYGDFVQREAVPFILGKTSQRLPADGGLGWPTLQALL